MIKNRKKYEDLNVKMTTTYNTLVSTNAIAIKNSKILTTKVTNSTKDLASVDESMAIQQSTLQTIQTTLDTIDKRMKTLTNDVTPEYTKLIQDTSHSLVQTIIEQHCSNPNTITILENLFDETIDNLADKKMGIIVNQSCKLMQDKANEITAGLDIAINKISNISTESQHNSPATITNKDQHDTLYNNVMNQVQSTDKASAPLSRNPLFPNVDPSKIGSTSQYYNNHAHPIQQTEGQGETKQRFHDNEYEFNSQRHFINTNTFYKLKWNNVCSSEEDILSFYESLQHIASTCGIPMNNLADITEFTGVCPLTKDNCENFEKVYKLMKGALFYKINDEKLWKGYTQGWNLVKANLLNCDGFEVLQDILSEVIPSLNMNMPKCHKIH